MTCFVVSRRYIKNNFISSVLLSFAPILFSVGLQSTSGLVHLAVEVSTSHTDTHIHIHT